MRIVKPLLILLFIFSAALLQAQSADVGTLEKHVSYLADDAFLGRGFGSEEGKRAADYIIENFKKNDVPPLLDTYRQAFMHRKGVVNIHGNNIVAFIEGSDPELKNEYIVLGAHYDHVGWELDDGDTIIYNGADDNASGVAGILELGRIFAENQGKLGRSVVLICFDGEESGLIGSKYFVDSNTLPMRDIAAMFSLDMIGMYYSHGGLDLEGIASLSNYKVLLSNASENAPIDILKQNASTPNRTDTEAFGHAGVPAIHAFTGLESPYHEPEDDSELLEYDGMAEVVNFIYELVVEMSKMDRPDPSDKMEKLEKKGAITYFNPGVELHTGGTFFDYPDQFFKAKGLFSQSIGLSLETRLNQWLAIQPEVHYEFQGSQYSDGNVRLHSATVPVSILITTPDKDGAGVRTYYQAGGYYTYHFAGTVGGEAMDFINEFNDRDYGLIFGMGMEIMNFRIAYVFKRSLSDATLTADDIRLKGSFARIGWVF